MIMTVAMVTTTTAAITTYGYANQHYDYECHKESSVCCYYDYDCDYDDGFNYGDDVTTTMATTATVPTTTAMAPDCTTMAMTTNVTTSDNGCGHYYR